MNALNSILVEGTVIADQVTKDTPKGSKVCEFIIASRRYFKIDGADDLEEETSFFDVETYGMLAESCGKSCVKGRAVRVVGRLKQERWTEKGEQKSRIKVIAEHIEFKPMFKAAKDAVL